MLELGWLCPISQITSFPLGSTRINHRVLDILRFASLIVERKTDFRMLFRRR